MSIEKIKKVTCIICMSKHPTKTVTDARKSKTVLKKSVNVLNYLASVTTKITTPHTLTKVICNKLEENVEGTFSDKSTQIRKMY